MMPPHLMVLCLIRAGQIILSLFLLWKAYSLRLPASIDVYCRSQAAASMSFDVSFPFAWIGVTGIGDCSTESETVTTRVWTGFGPTATLFTVLVGVTVAYAAGCVCVYALRHEWYDSNKKWPACDLLLSLLLGCIWSLDTWLAWRNFSSLKQAAHPDSVAGSLKVCSSSGGYCNANIIPDFGDVSSFLFLGLACALSCAVAVWFVFMETGLCPDDEDDELAYADFAPDVAPHAALSAKNGHFVPFSDYVYEKEDDFSNRDMSPADKALVQQQMMLYLSQWNKNGSKSEDRFANGFTFAPIRDPAEHVATISSNELTRDSIGNKVHSKFNLFKA